MKQTRSKVSSRPPQEQKATQETRGRPAKYNDPQVIEAICNALKIGASLGAAAQEGGVDVSSVKKWRQEAEKGDERYALFFASYKKAIARKEITLVADIRTAAKTQWQAAAWLLERLQPKRYGKKNSISFQGEAVVKNGSIAPEQFVKMLTASQLSQLVQAIENRTLELEAAKEGDNNNVGN